MPLRSKSMLGLILLSSHAAASDISTDRPTVAASAQTVGDRVFQIETGIQADINNGASIQAPTLARFGIGKNLELRADSSVAQVVDGVATIGGLGAGAKFNFARLEPMTMGILAGSGLPLGGDPASPYALLLADFNSGFWANAGWAGDTSVNYAAGYGVARSPFTPFLETAGGLNVTDGSWTGTVQGGVVWASGDLEWDVYLQTNLDGFDSHMLAAGLSYRIGAPSQ